MPCRTSGRFDCLAASWLQRLASDGAVYAVAGSFVGAVVAELEASRVFMSGAVELVSDGAVYAVAGSFVGAVVAELEASRVFMSGAVLLFLLG